MKIEERLIKIKCSATQKELAGRIVLPVKHKFFSGKPPLVMMLTGDSPKGSKGLSWVNFPLLLAQKGIASFLFDFEGLGNSEGQRDNLTLTAGIENYRAAFATLERKQICDQDRIGVFAASFGASVAVLAHETTNRACALGMKSPAPFLADAYLNESDSDVLEKWLEVGYSSELGYSIKVLYDALGYNVFAAARRITVRTLITHGLADDIVPVRHSRLLHACLSGDKRFLGKTGVGHNYAEPGAWDDMSNDFLDFFNSVF